MVKRDLDINDINSSRILLTAMFTVLNQHCLLDLRFGRFYISLKG